MTFDQLGVFVRSTQNDLSIGKIREFALDRALIEYFVGPGCAPRMEAVGAKSVTSVTLDCETRVYQPLPDGVTWRAGRCLKDNKTNIFVKFRSRSRVEGDKRIEQRLAAK
jgi:hypothetical protein